VALLPNPYEGGYAAARPCNGKELLSVAGLSPLPYWELFLGRPPVVKRQTSPESGFVVFFPLFRIGHKWHPVTRPDFISRCRCSGRVTAPHTYWGSIAVETTIAGLLSIPCDLETYLYLHTVLRKVVAKGVSFASEFQVRVGGSTR